MRTSFLDEAGSLGSKIRQRATMFPEPPAAGRKVGIFIRKKRGRDQRKAEHSEQQTCQDPAHNRIVRLPQQRCQIPIGYPRPTNGILVAITVRNCTLASSGRLAIYSTAF